MSHRIPGAKQRARAARALARVLTKGQTLDQLEPDPPFDPLERELLYGTLRHYFSLAYRASTLLSSPLKAKDQDLWALLLIGLYQLEHLSLPDHAAVASTAGAARNLKKPWGTGLINGCLRTAQRSLSKPLATLPRKGSTTQEEARYELPGWLIGQLKADHEQNWEALTEAFLTRAPMALRLVNSDQGAVEAALHEAGLHWSKPFEAETLVLDKACPVSALPGYDTGAVSVQDAGAQLGANALTQLWSSLSPSPASLESWRWADFCCAPGGKLFHALERWQDQPQSVLALDNSAKRLAQVAQEQKRLGHPRPGQSLELKLADASNPEQWWDGTAYDFVLLDAPCTGTGTLRRHPDVKLLRKVEDLLSQTKTQTALLQAAARVTRGGGGVLYATCSVLQAENDAIIDAFLEEHPDWQSVPLSLPSGVATAHGWQLLPIDPATDGFYYAALKHLN